MNQPLPWLQPLMELKAKVAAAWDGYAVALATRDPIKQIEANLTLAGAEEAVAAFLAPLGLETPWHPGHSAEIAANHLSMAADLLLDEHRVSDAEASEKRAIAIADRWCSLEKALEIRHSRVTRASQRGRFAAALTALVELRDVSAAAGFESVASDATRTRADMLRELGDPGGGLKELDRYPASEPSPTDHSRSLLWHISRFACLRDLAEFDPTRCSDAAGAFAVAKQRHRAYECVSGPSSPIVVYEISFLLAIGEFTQALAKIEELSVSFATEPDNRYLSGVLSMFRARALLALNRKSEARSAAKYAAEVLAASGRVGTEWRAWLLLADSTADRTERRFALAKGVAAVEQMRLAPLGWRLENLYLGPRLPIYRAAIAEAAAERDGPAALSLTEAVKSRTLTAIIGAGRGTPANADPALVRAHADLDAAIAGLQAAILGNSAPEGAAEVLATKRRIRGELAERLRQADPRWRALTTPDVPSPDAIAKAVHGLKAVALGFFLDGAMLTAVLVADGSVTVDCQMLAPPILHALKRLEHGLSPPLLDDSSRRPPDPRVRDPLQLGLSLRALLPSAMMARIAEANRLLVAPHGPLHLLPWPTLPMEPGGQRLIETAEVGVLPNLGCLPALSIRPPGSACCAALGAPVRDFGPEQCRYVAPPASATASEVAALHAAHGRLLGRPKMGPEATLVAFDELCAAPQAENAILHITSHGEPPQCEPGDAALLLADANLEAAALAHAGIPFSEVVLAACSTGFRPITEAQGVRLSGDDALGLPGALLEAGATTLLVSIPLAEVGAAHHMALGYHTARLAGQAPLAAFRSSQRALLSNPAVRTRNACGFVLYGCS
jgi:hypothetical protein